MGARRPPNERPQRGGRKCEFCGRSVDSVAALRAHQHILHSQALKDKMKRTAASQVQKAKKVTLKPKPKILKETVKTESSEESSPEAEVSQPKSKPITHKPEMKSANTTEPEKSLSQETLEATTSEVEQVASDSPDPIKPTRSSKRHESSDLSKQASESLYECSECPQRFKDTSLFNKHIEAEHSNLILSFYFPLKDEFLAWKKQLEASTKCTYVAVQELPITTTYRCKEFMTLSSDGHPQFCPSTIISNNTIGKGYTVDLYTSHYGHKHKKCNIQSMCNPKPVVQNAQSDDLYIKFQTLMENIVLDAAKIKIDNLKTLYDKAMEMKAFVNKYNEDDDEIETESSSKLSINTITTNSSQQDEIMNESLRSRKRSILEDGTPAKRIKGPTKKPSSFSLADDRDDDKILKELDDPNKIKQTPRKSLKSPSFNDTYKEFIDKTSKNKKPPPKKKNVVKTKIGIFKPNWPNGVSPKKEKRRVANGPSESCPKKNNKTSVAKVKDIKYEVRERENDCNILVLKL